MSAQQHGSSVTTVPPPPTAYDPSSHPASGSATGPFETSALRALPPLPHPDLLRNVTPTIALDLRRHLDQLSRLAERIGQHGIGESPPAPPHISSLIPLPLVPAPPTQISRPSAAAAAQTVRSRIQRRPKPFGRYSDHNVQSSADREGGVDEASARLDGNDVSHDGQLDRVLRRFNAVQQEEQVAESSMMGAARARRSLCSVKVDRGRGGDAIFVKWVPEAGDRSRTGVQKRRKVSHGGLMARIRLDPAAPRHAHMDTPGDQPSILNRKVRAVQLSRKLDTSSPMRISTSESLLSDLLTSQHLTLAELLDRLPHIPSILSSPCIFCSKYIRPPDGLPLQGVGFLPEMRSKHSKHASSDTRSASRAHDKESKAELPVDGRPPSRETNGDGSANGSADLEGASTANADGAEEQDGKIVRKGKVQADCQSRKGVQGRWVNWHASCDV